MKMFKAAIRPGEVYGRLTVISFTGEVKRGSKVFKCSCSCGNEKNVLASNLRHGITQSCGCLASDRKKERMTKHGLSKSRLFKIWEGMKGRCNDKDDKDYGGRGISYHESFQTFEGFLKGLPAGYNNGLTLDRIDVNGNYEPGNLRWASRKEQSNNRRDNVRVTDPKSGDVLTLSELSDRYGLPYRKFHQRLVRGWSLEDALSKPFRSYRKN
ncbi:hypothetical protein OGA59_004515 [Salmonella enterica]|nr:hypothetical protein [Salmonella enterica]EJY3320390.1 hypothetical protein [Salmonella enterica]